MSQITCYLSDPYVACGFVWHIRFEWTTSIFLEFGYNSFASKTYDAKQKKIHYRGTNFLNAAIRVLQISWHLTYGNMVHHLRFRYRVHDY